MKITLLVVGKTNSSYLNKGMEDYMQRLKHYVSFELKVIKDIKKGKTLTDELQKKTEGELILNFVNGSTQMILLDERGKSFTSEEFSSFIQKKMASGLKELVFVVGGAYGFSKDVYSSVKDRISVSSMTFPHELVRLIFLEQLYRAFTIIKGEPYHHD
ncbi:MAG: 23S rRNA (pseudouridine(1915)-N(3))-methyltransferase RlmH [Prolixibacteraceae bacterium]|nr:23S rRNA (pseudouridine(1915)-N(3))-methyltransferase RlmH [Prolixibacteraceae bacterium]MBN2775092.1 23S rRNA (pseudouridine(1915)-N(3))-methyltransferase RlmH [Prolixibacteraceae bacterium]